ncbi:hypothetical protein ZIOFF_040830 [Zingiber officinale]|uniref:NAD(P)H dehydrogenase (quinone) n=1 Tax=Zingiber officinale TaxID=94328 RepID=A0A8J5L1B8_ZINOF|nr:hypothetical protein ZIOFF_040830 [Zingiber officinale]
MSSASPPLPTAARSMLEEMLAALKLKDEMLKDEPPALHCSFGRRPPCWTCAKYYSMYGHVAKLAEEIQKGVNSVEGVEVKLWQVPETLSEEVIGKMGAPPKSDVPIIQPNDLAEADGILLGFPTRFGMMAAQFKAFIDATGGLWRSQALAGKPAGIFYSTGSQGGGQETTPLTAITQLAHHGMIFVPIGYTFGAGMFEMADVKGGSPYGAGTYAGDGSRNPSQLELEQAFHQGKYFATIAKKLKASS